MMKSIYVEFILFFQGIAKNKTLQHLSLEFCLIGDSGVESKFLNLQVMTTFQMFLGLRQFSFTQQVTFLCCLRCKMHEIFFFNYFVVLCNAIKNNTSLMTVNFSGCSLTWRGADTLAKVIRVSSAQYTLIMTSFDYKIDIKTAALNKAGCQCCHF